MKFEDFWYVVALSQQLTAKAVLARTVLDEWLVIFRDAQGQPVALQDRCLHRNSRLSAGKLQGGQLQCSYHGWQYDGNGNVVAVPAEGGCPKVNRKALRYATREQDGYVYVRLAAEPFEDWCPFSMPYYQVPGWATVRAINRFHNTVTNCVENFIDIPHTVSVHPGIFRRPRQERLRMEVSCREGTVTATYRNETTNLGWYRWFLNPQGREIRHVDRFLMPNVTSVEYDMGPSRQCLITSQSVPETGETTLVYTDVTFNYGLWTWLSLPFVSWTAQRIIAQDVVVLRRQQETIAKYGQRFAHTPADTIHVFVEAIMDAIATGKDPRQLPEKSVEVSFWV